MFVIGYEGTAYHLPQSEFWKLIPGSTGVFLITANGNEHLIFPCTKDRVKASILLIIDSLRRHGSAVLTDDGKYLVQE